ncbi:MAG: porin [Bacteroidetes bacterium]|nr:MAG: porin [Bacteroidota bacterium]
MKTNYLFLSLVAVLFTAWFSSPVQAQDETKKEDEDKGEFSISGYLDSYYFTNFNMPKSRDNMGQSGVGRGFDRRLDQFQIGMVQTVFKYKTKKSEMVADLAYGQSAVYGNYGNVPNLPAGSSVNGLIPSYYGVPLANDAYSAIIIKQAYFNYKATEKLSFTAGQFGTHIGYEMIDAPLNYFYSINHTFNSGIPFYHLGLKATYEFNSKVSLMLGAVNGFDYLHDNNRGKGLIWQLTLKPMDGLTVYFNGISTNEASADSVGGAFKSAPKGNFTVYDLVANYNVGKWNFTTWLLLGSADGLGNSFGTAYNLDKTRNWGGANFYAVYNFNDVFSLGTRVEYFDNSAGVRGLLNKKVSSVSNEGVKSYEFAGADCYTYTLTSNIKLANGHITLKPEFRYDFFKKVEGALNEDSQQFMDEDGKYTKNSQATLGMAMVYSF